MNISIIGSRGYPYVYSGYETFVKELSERLVIKDINVYIYCHSSLFKKRKKLINGINLIYTPSISSKFFSQIFNSFFSILHACFSNTDIILVVNVANGPFGLLTKLFNKKTIINVDGLEWKRPKWKGIGSVYFKISAYLATKLYDVIVTDSLEMKKVYLNKFKTESEVIAYGPHKIENRDSNILTKLSLEPYNYILIVGRMIPDNNSDLIIKSYKKSKLKKKLVIVGDVPYKDFYANSLKKNTCDQIIFTGYINDKLDLSTLFKNCMLYIHGHEFGGTNPTLVTALNFRCNIFALDTVFNNETLEKGKCGYFFKKDDNSLIKLLNNFCDNPKMFQSKSNSIKLKNEYNWDVIVDKYLRVFINLKNM